MTAHDNSSHAGKGRSDSPDNDHFLLRQYLEKENSSSLRDVVSTAHAADIADFIEQIDSKDRSTFIRLVGNQLNPKVLSKLEESIRDEILPMLDDEYLPLVVSGLDTDEIVYLVEGLNEEQRCRILHALELVDRLIVEKCLEYPEDYAGRMIQGNMITAPAFWTVGQLLDILRSNNKLPKTFYEVVVVDSAFSPVGIVALYDVVRHGRDKLLQTIMRTDFISFDVDSKQSDVARCFYHYHLLSAPIVDKSGYLVGIITIDDAMEVLHDETEDDFRRLGGVGNETISDGILEVFRRRFPWLIINLFTAILASGVILAFDKALEQFVALAVLMPIVASMGGNAGTQTLTVVVRALATKTLTQMNTARVIMRELFVGCINGSVFAILVGVLEYLWFKDIVLGLIISMSVIINMIAAAVAGILIPIYLHKFKADPANGSSVLVTTFTDVVGFLSFLGMATLFLLS